MKLRAAPIALLLAVATVAGSGAQAPSQRPAASERRLGDALKDPAGWPDTWPAADPGLAPQWDGGALPTPSLKEPFAIGEALYDPGRMADAVMSLLALMQIPVVPDSSAATSPANRARGITLSASEARALIDLGLADMQGADGLENRPFTFSDFHASVADLLPGVSVSQLAEAYTEAYGQRSDDLIASMLMGQPLEPDTKLTRTQMWFLLLDGFAGAASSDGRWGTADRTVPDLRSPNTQWSADEWREVLARLPLLSASRLVELNAPPVIAQGTPAATMTARVRASAPPLVSRVTGRTLIAARAGSLAGQEVTWKVGDDSALRRIGTIGSPIDQPVRVGADGSARLVVQPGADPTGGAGQAIDEWATVEARFDGGVLSASAYTLPAPLARLAFGPMVTRANVRVRYRSPDVLWLRVVNKFDGVTFNIPGLGGGTRTGEDSVIARIARQPDGSYSGRGTADAFATLSLTSGPCPGRVSWARQEVHVVATPETAFGPVHDLGDYFWLDPSGAPSSRSMAAAAPDGGYFSVTFYPVTEPEYPTLEMDDCQPLLPAQGRLGYGANYFVPFNDAQWTTPGQGYGIALKAAGVTAYVDNTSKDPLAGSAVGAAIKNFFKLTGQSVWTVKVARKRSGV